MQATLLCDVAGAAWVMGDKELLTQTFANLIENAIRHCPTGTKITCSVRAKGNRVSASVLGYRAGNTIGRARIGAAPSLPP